MAILSIPFPIYTAPIKKEDPMTKKAWIYILIFLVLLFGLPFLFHEEKKDDDEMNSKEINESTPLLQQDFRVDFSPRFI